MKEAVIIFDKFNTLIFKVLSTLLTLAITPMVGPHSAVGISMA